MLTSLALLLSTAAPDCTPLPGWDTVASEARGHYLIFGELHGTVEAPRAVGEYACAVSRDASVLVAVELGSRSNEGLQRAWAASVGEFRSVLLAEVSDFRTRKDGVSSLAMLDLLERLHRLKAAGGAIAVVAFNGAKDEEQVARFAHLPGQEPHESAQAENIRAAAAAGDFDHVIVLVGNLHAKKRPVSFGGPEWRPMAMILAQDVPVLTLNMAYSDGTAWTCERRRDAAGAPAAPMAEAQVECAAHPAKGLPAYADPRMVLSRSDGSSYDGVFALGEIQASPPVID